MRFNLSFAVLTCAVLGSVSSFASADINGLLPRVPADANAIVAINVTAALDSEVGKAQGWGTKEGDRPLFLPRHATNVVFAANFNFAQAESDWEVGLVEMDKELSMAAMQLSESGLKDTLATLPAVWSSRKAYFIGVDKNLLAVVSPDNRQFATKFAGQQLKPGTTVLPPYLATAAGQVKTGAEIVMAFNLQDAIGMNKVRRSLTTNLTRAAILQDTSIEEVAKILASAKGITLKVDLSKDIDATLNVDFGADPAVLKSVAIPLLVDVLSNNGLGMKDVESWQATASGQSLVYKGKLSPHSFRLVMGLIEPQTPAESAKVAGSGAGSGTPSAAGSAAPADAGEAAVLAASQKYYKQMIAMLDGFSQTASAGDGAAWLRRAAKQVDRMSLVNVDTELAQWGTQVSANLLDCAQQLATGQRQITSTAAGAYGANVVTAYNYTEAYSDVKIGSDPEARAGYARQSAAMVQQTQAERARVAGPVAQRMAEIIASKSKIRLAMVARYKVDF